VQGPYQRPAKSLQWDILKIIGSYTQTKVVLHKEKDKIIENQNNQSGKS
jgi:hypothetical protein